MYDKQVRRRRAVLVALVACCILLLTAYFGESERGVSSPACRTSAGAPGGDGSGVGIEASAGGGRALPPLAALAAMIAV